MIEGDNKLIDLITTYGKSFPLKDSDDNEIVSPTEVFFTCFGIQ